MSKACSNSSTTKPKESPLHKKMRWLLVALACVVPFEILSLLDFKLPLLVELALFCLIAILFGRDILVSGVKSLFHLKFADINLLMTVAIVGAVYLQEFAEAIIIMVLFSLGNILEEIGMEKSQQALQDLVAKTPQVAKIKGSDTKIAINDIKVGDIVIVQPGDQIPLDGVVTVGESLVDEAVITGEPLPKNKNLGEKVYAGTLNGQGYLEIEVIKVSKESTISKIIELTYQSVERKSSSQKFIEQFAQYYTPFVLIAAVILVIIPVLFLGQPFLVWFERSLTFLIISCPCALVISTPIAVFSAVGNASKKGIIVKGGKYIEILGKIKAIAFDKTRTLTEGKPVVSEIIPMNGHSEASILACAAGIEAFSEHPIAQGIVEKAKDLKLTPHQFDKFQSFQGKGIAGNCLICTDSYHYVGTLQFLQSHHVVDQDVEEIVKRIEHEGNTAIVMSDNDEVTGILSVTDKIRPESSGLIASLKKLHITPVILTGDNLSAASHVAQAVGIATVKAALLPDGKVKEVDALIKTYEHVAMVGDGINDAPALARSSVGIAMGAIGSDVAIENADIALMHDNISLIPYLIRLGRRTVRTIKFNVSAAILVKVSFMLLALFGKSNLALAIFADVGVTILVILNSLRLFSFK